MSSKNEIKNWNSSVEGKVRVFANEIEYGKGKNKKSFTKFTTSISQKNEDDEYVNFYIDIGFKKGEEPEDIGDKGKIIEILDGFLTCYAYDTDDGVRTKLKLVIMEWQEVESESKSKEEKKTKK